jgi:hypothetical protein
MPAIGVVKDDLEPFLTGLHVHLSAGDRRVLTQGAFSSR